jgi:hypothetical protein
MRFNEVAPAAMETSSGSSESTGGQSTGQFTLIPMPTTIPPGLRGTLPPGSSPARGAKISDRMPATFRSVPARPGRGSTLGPGATPAPAMRSLGHFSDSSTPAVARQAPTAASATAHVAR